MGTIVLPTYLTVQPSTGKKISFRPFTVKEEKSLLLALQEDDYETTAAAIKNLVKICTDNKVDVDEAPYYDLEYIFLQIRAKSVGEIIDMMGTCTCGVDKKTEFGVDISDTVVIPQPTDKVTLKIPDTNYSMVFGHPSIDDFVLLFQNPEENTTTVVTNCCKTIFTDEEVMDWSFAGKKEFIESMTSKQQKDISEFLRNMPTVQLPAKYTCKHCSKEHSSIMTGFANFFV